MTERTWDTATDAGREPRRPPRVLVVDDERSMRELLSIVLQARRATTC